MPFRAKLRQLLVQSGDEPLTKERKLLLFLTTLIWGCEIAYVTRGFVYADYVDAIVLVIAYTAFITWFVWNLSEAPELLRAEQMQSKEYGLWATTRRVAFITVVSALFFPLVVWLCLKDWE
jgi:hypothetical protein